MDLAPNNVGILSDLGYVYAVCGRRADARKIIEELGHQAARRPVSSHYIACIYAGLGEKGLAMEWLEKAYQENSQWLVPHQAGPATRDSPRRSAFRGLIEEDRILVRIPMKKIACSDQMRMKIRVSEAGSFMLTDRST